MADDLFSKILAITARAESGDRDYNADGSPVRSPAGALYKMQVLPSTAASPGYGVRPVAAQTPEEYNRVGRDLLKANLQKYGDPAKMWAAYHSGRGNVDHLGPRGSAYVKSNLAALGKYATPAPEEAPMEDDTPMEADAPEVAGSGFGVKDVLDEYRQTTQSLAAQQQAEAEARKQQFEAARDALAKQRFGPSLSERLFALSAAIGRPRYQQERGIGAVMGDIAAPLSALLSGKRDAEEQRADAMRKLQETYMNGGLDAQHKALDARVKMLPTLATLAKSQQPNPGVWSESMGRFIPKDHPVPTGSGVVGGLRVVKYSDGTHRVRGNDGKITVYDAAGQKIGVQGGPQ